MKIETKLYLQGTVKVILQRRHMNQAYQETGLKFQINSLCLQLKELEKVEQPSPKFVEGIIKFREEISKIQTKK